MLNVEMIREYCLSKKGTTESFPFDEHTLVFKVMNKMFAICPLDELRPSLALKCDPEKAVDLRERYAEVIPGFHLNKHHWNTIYLDGPFSAEEFLSWVDHSYDLICAGLKKADKEKLKQL